MANNLVEYLAQLRTENPKRANWLMDCLDVGTNTFGFIKPKLVKEVIAGSHVTYDFKSAYSSNPTISPVLSRAKVSVCAIWIPASLYVPAFRDGVEVKAGKSDYAFPTINFDYPAVERDFKRLMDAAYSSNDVDYYERRISAKAGRGLPYIPNNSIFSELGMWRPHYQPVGYSSSAVSAYPSPKNAIPLLGYYDFFRHYVMNSQVTYAPFRAVGYSVVPKVKVTDNNGVIFDDLTTTYDYNVQYPIDVNFEREDIDKMFQRVRSIGSSYPDATAGFNVTPALSHINLNIWPTKKVSVVIDGNDMSDPATTISVTAFNDDHFGEMRQTYFADRNTAFLSNESVDYERSTARVVTDDDGVLTMEQIYAAQRVQNFVRKTIFKNSDYAEFIDAQYGITPPTNLTKPMFLGKVSSWISFNDVVSQAQTSDDHSVDSNTSLGSRSSIGFGRMVTGKLRSDKDRHFVSFTAREPGYFMVLEWIVPEVSYFQGYDPMYDKLSLGSVYYPSFDRDGYQDKQYRYLNEQTVNRDLGFNVIPPRRDISEYNVAVAQEPAWWEYMATINKMSGQMSDPGVYRHWVFHREYDDAQYYDPNVNVYSRSNIWSGTNNFVFDEVGSWQDHVPIKACNIYVNPEDFQHIWANEQGLDNFQTFYKHDLKLYQPLSHRFLSY